MASCLVTWSHQAADGSFHTRQGLTNELNIFLNHAQKNPSKDLSIRLKSIKFLGKNTGRKFFDINHSKIFSSLYPKAQKREEKLNKWDLLKLKSFPTEQESNDKRKKNYEAEEIFANDMTNNGFISKIYKHLMPHNMKKSQPN